MRTLPLVSATALAIAIMPGGAKASSFLSIAKPISILSNPIKIEPAKTSTIPVVSLGSSKTVSIVLPLFDGKSGLGTVSNPIVQIIDQIVAKAPVASPTKPETGAGSTPTPNGKDCDPKTGKPIETGPGPDSPGAAAGHEGGKSGKDCDPKGIKGSHGDGAHGAGHATGGKDCDPHQGKGDQGHGSTGHDGGNGGTTTGGSNSGTNSGGTGNGGSSEIPPAGDPGNAGGDDDSNASGDAGSGDSGTDGLPGGSSDDTGAGDTGSGGMTGIGSGADTGNAGDTGAGTIPSGGIGTGAPSAGGDGSHIGGGGDQALAGAVPEPASWMTMIAGFGLVGAAMRAARKRGLILA